MRELPTLNVPFQLRGYAGQITVRCCPNDNPARWGMDMLNLPMELDRVRGFPVMRATLVFDGDGYHGEFGWIQILSISAQPSGQSFHLLDKFGAFEGPDTPYSAFGFLPTLFDAPALDALPGSTIRWRADAFLTVCPTITATRDVVYVAAFRWGFTVTDQQPEVDTPEPLSVDDWNCARPFLTEQCPNWNFLPATDGS